MPWIAISIGGMVVMAAAIGLMAMRVRHLRPVTDGATVQPVNRTQTALIGGGMALMAVLIVGFTPMDTWFLAPALFVAAWVPHASRRALSPAASVTVAGMFTAATIISVVVRVFVLGE